MMSIYTLRTLPFPAMISLFVPQTLTESDSKESWSICVDDDVDDDDDDNSDISDSDNLIDSDEEEEENGAKIKRLKYLKLKIITEVT